MAATTARAERALHHRSAADEDERALRTAWAIAEALGARGAHEGHATTFKDAHRWPGGFVVVLKQEATQEMAARRDADTL